ncbi:MAG: hypothetical protein V4808_17260 [Pseudomonadota bacterium]
MLTALLLIAAPLPAQTSPDIAALVEAERPRVAPRKLSKEEQATAKSAIAALEANPGIETLRALRPFGEAGDKKAMWALMRAHVRLAEIWRANDNAAGRPVRGRIEHIYDALAAIWASHLWRAGEADREVATSISPCLEASLYTQLPGYSFAGIQRTFAATAKNFDCGFDIAGAEGYLLDIQLAKVPTSKYQVAQGNRAKIRFTDRPMRPQAEIDNVRYAFFMDSIVKNYALWNDDMIFAEEYILARPELAAAYWDARLKRAIKTIYYDYYKPKTENSLWAQMQRDPVLKRAYEAAVQKWLATLNTRPALPAGDEDLFDQRMASHNWNATDKHWMANVAIASGGKRAEQWYDIFGYDLTGMPNQGRWCRVGARKACADDDASRRELAARSANPNSNGGYVWSTPSADALIKYNASVNAANCARALKGASITCSLP